MLTEKLDLEPGETIIERVRKHWFIITIEIAGVALAALFPFMFLPVLFSLMGNGVFQSSVHVPIPAYTALGSGWLLIMWMVFFNTLTNYFLDTWTITNRRLIVVDQWGFFNRTISSFRLERLQDLSIDIRGILPTLLDFGTLHAQTAGADNKEFRATGLPRPKELKERMLTASGGRTEGAARVDRRMEI